MTHSESRDTFSPLGSTWKGSWPCYDKFHLKLINELCVCDTVGKHLRSLDIIPSETYSCAVRSAVQIFTACNVFKGPEVEKLFLPRNEVCKQEALVARQHDGFRGHYRIEGFDSISEVLPRVRRVQVGRRKTEPLVLHLLPLHSWRATSRRTWGKTWSSFSKTPCTTTRRPWSRSAPTSWFTRPSRPGNSPASRRR